MEFRDFRGEGNSGTIWAGRTFLRGRSTVHVHIGVKNSRSQAIPGTCFQATIIAAGRHKRGTKEAWPERKSRTRLINKKAAGRRHTEESGRARINKRITSGRGGRFEQGRVGSYQWLMNTLKLGDISHRGYLKKEEIEEN